jgi:hypothetical protein
MQTKFLAAFASLAVAVPAWAGAVPDAKPAPQAAPPAAGQPGAAQPQAAPKPPPPPTEAEIKCQAEAVAAVDKQKQSGQYRMEADMITDAGPVKLKEEYILPNRMRQIVKVATEPQSVEVILIESKGWRNAGEGWEPLPPDEVKQLIESRLNTAANSEEATFGRWDCIGKQPVDGRELTGYQGKDDKPKDVSPGGPTMPENEAVRIMYVDPATGLPERGIFARKAQLDKPIFKEVYSYPADLKIEPPSEVK